MDNVKVKQEIIEQLTRSETNQTPEEASKQRFSVIDLSSTDSDSSSSSSSSSSDDDVSGVNGKRRWFTSSGDGVPSKKKKKWEALGVVLPAGFLDPLPPKEAAQSAPKTQSTANVDGKENGNEIVHVQKCKQFWKAGDFEEIKGADWDTTSGGIDRVRVHPRFLHSNATSHKWVLGAFAELLDNSLDEVCNGATYVNIDMIKNKKDESKMLLIEDNGGGMDPDKMRQCMSLGYSLKSKVADTIGQYGNGFKTSTMRLGADVIVFSRCSGKDGKSVFNLDEIVLCAVANIVLCCMPTQSIGLLSYTFLRSTGKEDIVVPMLDYKRGGQEWNKLLRSSAGDWNRNVETIAQWSPFSSEADLLRQFNHMKDRGTRIIIYNLWEDDQGLLELDLDTDQHDIQIRGVNRDEKKIQMAQKFPNSWHFLTYRHSLRSYASILYLRIPFGFRMILRGKDIEHHNIVNDMMMTQELTYRPQTAIEGVPQDSNMVAVVKMGFVKDAKSHIDVQGFNVYHKNRLIKPFWRLWNSTGSDGRGVIGVLEANFVEPAHDKQGFERTIVLSRLEARLIKMQKTYWSKNCHKIGYAPRHNKKNINKRETSPDYLPKKKNTASSSKTPVSGSDKFCFNKNQKAGGRELDRHPKTVDKSHDSGPLYGKEKNRSKTPTKSGKGPWSSEPSSPSAEDISDNLKIAIPDGHADGNSGNGGGKDCSPLNCDPHSLDQLKEENSELRERLKKKEEEVLGDLLHDLQYERERCKSLQAQLQEVTRQIEGVNKEQEKLIDKFSVEREHRDIKEENLRKKFQEASNTIQELLGMVRLLEEMKSEG